MLRQFTRLGATKKVSYVLKPQSRTLTGLTVGVPKETLEGEERVAITPPNVVKLVKAGASVSIEKNAGLGSGFTDLQYTAAGATIVTNAEAWKTEVVAKVRPPSVDEAKLLENRSIVGIIQKNQNPELMKQFVSQNSKVFALDSLMRTLSRGQSFDVLSSQANIAGYRAVIEASHALQRPFAGQMTAAGKLL
jgi:NAD(P) transhydrogenase